MKTYEINGTSYSQGRLTVASLLRLTRLVKGRVAGGVFELSVEGITALIEDPEVAPEFLAAVFGLPAIDFDPMQMPAEALVEVITDFLSLNGGTVPKLTALLNATASLVKGAPALPLETPSAS